ncbi:MAG: hypothetical protein Q8M32_13985 [Brevundimonas sp.]|nr:hypothetical protein [Brevundimonas sp.]
MPTIQHPRDAIVRVTRSCICGSDLHPYRGMAPDTRVACRDIFVAERTSPRRDCAAQTAWHFPIRQYGDA